MAGKKIDLSSYKNIDTEKTQVKHNKYTRFIENEVAAAPESEADKLKRMNMAFTDNNYTLIQSEANRLGINMAYFINAVIRAVPDDDVDKYLDALPIRPSKNHVPRRKGNPAKRLNFKIEDDAHVKITAGAEKHNETLTQYANTIIEVYAQANNN